MSSRCIFNNLAVGCWHIEGADEKINSVKISKLGQPYFRNTLKMFDIFCVQETHLSVDENIPEIMTIEKLVNCFHLAEGIGSHESFKKITRCKVNETYREFWKYELENVNLGRLQFYREVKNNNNIEKYRKLEDFEHR